MIFAGEAEQHQQPVTHRKAAGKNPAPRSTTACLSLPPERDLEPELRLVLEPSREAPPPAAVFHKPKSAAVTDLTITACSASLPAIALVAAMVFILATASGWR